MDYNYELNGRPREFRPPGASSSARPRVPEPRCSGGVAKVVAVPKTSAIAVLSSVIPGFCIRFGGTTRAFSKKMTIPYLKIDSAGQYSAKLRNPQNSAPRFRAPPPPPGGKNVTVASGGVVGGGYRPAGACARPPVAAKRDFH